MNTVVGLFLAVIGLFLIWLWASGRAQAVWQDLWSGSAQSGFSNSAGQPAMNAASAGGWGLPNLLNDLPNLTNSGLNLNSQTGAGSTIGLGAIGGNAPYVGGAP